MLNTAYCSVKSTVPKVENLFTQQVNNICTPLNFKILGIQLLKMKYLHTQRWFEQIQFKEVQPLWNYTSSLEKPW